MKGNWNHLSNFFSRVFLYCPGYKTDPLCFMINQEICSKSESNLLYLAGSYQIEVSKRKKDEFLKRMNLR